MLYTTRYYQKDVVLADVCATDAPYGADPRGEIDSTTALRAALGAVAALGGGVVYLPAGRYLITDTVVVPSGCILQGDWQDPNGTDTPEYGTLIIAKPAPLTDEQLSDRAASPLFFMEGKCGMIGLTFYYPAQDTRAPKAYGYTIYSEAPRIAALRDITMINAYRGVGVGANGTSGHELMQNESLRICALETAIEMYRSSEVGNTVDIDVSPRYWIEAGCGFACAHPEALRQYCRANTRGIVLQQLDDEHLSTLRLECCRIGVHFPRRRYTNVQGFWGLLYDVTVTDCDYGILVEELCSSVGVVIARATIDADVCAILNTSSASTLKLCGITLLGKGGVRSEGRGSTMWDADTDLSAYEIRYGSYRKPAAYHYPADIKAYSATGEDVAPIIQAALDASAATGGVVSLPAGIYTVCSTLRVPRGTQLRGPTPVFVRDTTEGTPEGCVLLTYVADAATITLEAHAGVFGLRIFCPLYDTATAKRLLERDDDVIRRCVGIRGLGEGVYTYNVGVTATMVGVDFSGCDRHLIKQTFGCVYSTFARVGGTDGIMESCLCNPHFINRQSFAAKGYCNASLCDPQAWEGLCAVSEAGTSGVGFALLRDDVLRRYCTMVHVDHAHRQRISNIFMYAPYALVTATRSDALLLNTSADFVGFGAVYMAREGSCVTAVNALRSAGDSVSCDETSELVVCNRINTEIYFEGDYDSHRGREDDFAMQVTNRLPLAPEDSLQGVEYVTLNTDPRFIKQGSCSYCHTPSGNPNPDERLIELHFDAVDITRYCGRDGYLHLSIYAEDMSTQLWGGFMQLGSAGDPSKDLLYWVATSYITHNGWNEVWLSLADAKALGCFDPTHANYFRIYTMHNPSRYRGNTYIDDVYLCEATSPRIRLPLPTQAKEERQA